MATLVEQKSRPEPSVWTLSTRRYVRPPRSTNEASMPPLSSPGNVQPTSWLKNFENPGQPSQFFAHRPVESDVHATERPRPYCHWARSGSSRPVTSTVWAADFAVVPL